jgi:exopolysaccharide production protein ExoZ
MMFAPAATPAGGASGQPAHVPLRGQQPKYRLAQCRLSGCNGTETQLTVEAPPRDVVAIQMLRGIAAMMVVFVHIDVQLPRLGYARLGTSWLATGVDIFFVISGFIMWTSVERRGGISPGAFLKNRLIRIVPLYWLVTTAVLIIALVAPQLLNTTVVRPWHVLLSYLFLPARHPLLPQKFWPLVVPGWSLNYEMLFYGVFAIAIALSGGRRTLRGVLLIVLLVLVLLVATLSKSSFDVMNFYANPIQLEFATGVLMGIVCTHGSVRRSALWLAAVPVGFVLLWAGTQIGGGIPLTIAGATMIVAGAVFAPPFPNNPMSALGDASYSLYLTHTFALAAATIAWRELFPDQDWRLYILASVALAVLVAFATYKFFELPATAALKRFSAGETAGGRRARSLSARSG